MQSEKAIRYRPAIILSNDLNEETNMKLVQGFGINDLRDQCKTSKEFSLWCSMLTRCYSEKLHARIPTYKDCSTSNEFRRYSGFKNWCQSQIGFGVVGFELDKDIIQKGNKEYHPDKCVFLPREVNAFLRTRKKSRGLLPIGVTTLARSSGYMAFLNNKKEKIYLGTFPTTEKAFQAYKVAKEQAIKDMANKWKDQIDPRAYNALMAYQVEITD